MTFAQRWLKSCFAIVIFGVAVQISAAASSITFKITLPATQQQPLTGRVFVIIARANDPEPRLQVGSWRSRTEMLAVDVQGLAPGQANPPGALPLGYPLKSGRDAPAGGSSLSAP